MVSPDATVDAEGTTTGGAVLAAAVAAGVAGGVTGVGTVEPQPANTITSAIPADARATPLNITRLIARAL
jgi:hypothetical protein